jgi:hypothetical protein
MSVTSSESRGRRAVIMIRITVTVTGTIAGLAGGSRRAHCCDTVTIATPRCPIPGARAGESGVTVTVPRPQFRPAAAAEAPAPGPGLSGTVLKLACVCVNSGIRTASHDAILRSECGNNNHVSNHGTMVSRRCRQSGPGPAAPPENGEFRACRPCARLKDLNPVLYVYDYKSSECDGNSLLTCSHSCK